MSLSEDSSWLSSTFPRREQRKMGCRHPTRTPRGCHSGGETDRHASGPAALPPPRLGLAPASSLTASVVSQAPSCQSALCTRHGHRHGHREPALTPGKGCAAPARPALPLLAPRSPRPPPTLLCSAEVKPGPPRKRPSRAQGAKSPAAAEPAQCPSLCLAERPPPALAAG